MAFVDRVVEHPNRWKLVNVDDPTDVKIYDVTREEGEVTNPGTPLNAESLNGEIQAAAAAGLADFDIDETGNVRVQNIQCGAAKVTVMKANTTYTKSVTFAQPFTAVPRVVATAVSAAPEKVNVSVKDVTTTGFSLYMNRTTATNTTVNWIAMI